jgi:hypothetical protein
VVGAILFTLFIMPPVLSMTLGLAFPLRVVVSVLLVAPLGVLLGVPISTKTSPLFWTALAVFP